MKKYPTLKMFEHGIKLVEMLLSLRSSIGESFYDFIKIWESLVVGFIVKDPVHDLGFDSLYESSLKDMNDIYNGFKNSGLLKLMIPPNTETETLMYYCEFTGISKLFGHPVIPVVPGFQKLKEDTTSPYEPNDALIQKLRNMWVVSFCKQYYEKEHKWPVLNLENSVGPSIINCYLENRWFSDEELTHLTLT